MSDAIAESLCKLVIEHTDVESTNAQDVKIIPLDPFFTTYEVAGHWIKLLKGEPRNPDFTPLHRDFFVLDTIDRQNRATLDLTQHVPIPKPIKIETGSEILEQTYLLTKALAGEPLLKPIATNGTLPDSERKAIGTFIGRALAKTHSIVLKGCGLITTMKHGVHPGPWQKYYKLVTDAQWKHLKGSGLVEDSLIDKLAQLVEDNLSVLIGETVSLSHNDFQYSNIWIDQKEKIVTGLVNFSQAGAGSPMADIASFYVHCHDPKLWEATTSGYQELRSLPDKYEKRLPFYSFIFGMRAAWFFMQRKDEASKGYYLRRALEAAATLDDSFSVAASKYASFKAPVYRY